MYACEISESLLKAVDMFGSLTPFTIKYKQKYRTLFGGLLTIITGVVFVVLFILMGTDFINRTNPNVNVSDYNGDYEIVDLMKSNYTMGIMIGNGAIDYFGKQLWLEASLTYMKDNNQATTNKIPVVRCDLLPYTPYQFHRNTSYCLDFSTHSLLGINETFLGALYVKLLYCDPTQTGTPSCTSFADIKKITEDSPRIIVTYPQFKYDLREKKNPENTTVATIISPFDYNLPRKDKYTFYKMVSNDDQGYIFENIKKKEFWTIESYRSDLNFISDTDLQNPVTDPKLSELYSMEFDVSTQTTLYTRSFMKLPDVLAVSMTVVKILMVVFEVIARFINIELVNFEIFDHLFFTGFPDQKTSRHNTNNSSKMKEMSRSKSNNQLPAGNSSTEDNQAASKGKCKCDCFCPPKKLSKAYTYCYALTFAFVPCCLSKRNKTFRKEFAYGKKITKKKLEISNYIQLNYDIKFLQDSLFKDREDKSIITIMQRRNVFDDYKNYLERNGQSDKDPTNSLNKKEKQMDNLSLKENFSSPIEASPLKKGEHNSKTDIMKISS